MLTSPGLTELHSHSACGALTAMTDETKTYRVTDRRHFTPDGESVAADAPPPEPDENVGGVSAVEGQSAPAIGTPGPDHEPPADFLALIVSLGTQASVLLGGLEGREPDLRGARWLISILEMLREKTEGRRTAQETEALESLLFELRMAYVGRTRTGGA